MDIRYPAEYAGFREQVLAWLKDNLSPELVANAVVSRDEEAWAAMQREWDRKLYAGGWAGLAWPREYGGGGASLINQVIFHEEMAWANAPEGLNTLGLKLLGPTLIQYGTEAQKRRFLPPILKADEIWCQGFSEPNAGSDMASVSTRGELNGDHYVVNGQKVWTSRAQWADWMFALVRTDPKAPKHKGITFLLLDMRQPGVTVRPLRQITGGAEFNEVFLDGVKVPVENVVAQPGEGWKVAMTLLGFERGAMITTRAIRCQAELERLIAVARPARRHGQPLLADPVFCQKLARLYAEVRILHWNSLRTLTQMIKGEPGTVPGAYGKLMWSEVHQRLGALALELQGPFSQLDAGSQWVPDDGLWQFTYLRSLSETIYAGTSEIQRNIVGERVLGLPR